MRDQRSQHSLVRQVDDTKVRTIESQLSRGYPVGYRKWLVEHVLTVQYCPYQYRNSIRSRFLFRLLSNASLGRHTVWLMRRYTIRRRVIPFELFRIDYSMVSCSNLEMDFWSFLSSTSSILGLRSGLWMGKTSSSESHQLFDDEMTQIRKVQSMSEMRRWYVKRIL